MLPETLPAVVTDSAFCASVAFVHRRYAYGHAVLSVSAQETAWLAPDSCQPAEPGDLMPTILKLLRGNPSSCVTAADILQAELGLKRMLEHGDRAERDIVRQHIARLWQALQELGVGALQHSPDGPFFRKSAWHALPPAVVRWLRRQRVPLFIFGPPARQRELDLVASQVPGLMPDADVSAAGASAAADASASVESARAEQPAPALPTASAPASRGQKAAQTRAAPRLAPIICVCRRPWEGAVVAA